jgi:dihydroorotase
MSDLLIRNATIVNEDQIYNADVKISNGIIEQIGTNLSDSNVTETINADGLHLLPGVIDDQVHFREPGATHKATIASESRAAVAGGTTSFMDMPNTSPQTTDQEQFNAKLATAAATSVANYGFFLGATNSNLEEIKKVDPRKCPGIKIFMGSSTGNMLVDHQNVLEDIFRESPVLIATHCEKPEIISANEQKAREKYGEDVPVREHPNIRSRTACIESTRIAFNLAKKHHADLHILHLSTREEVELLSELKQIPFAEKHITAEACTPHIAFTDSDYEQLGTRIKCNPAVKTAGDRDALLWALKNNVVDLVATDHAPHLMEEKNNTYFKAPSGIPVIQHSLTLLLELYHEGRLTLADIVRLSSHNVARRYRICDRGFIREGYRADLVLVNLNTENTVTREQLFSKCRWSPFEGRTFHSSVYATLVNGAVIFREGKIVSDRRGEPLQFNRR